MDCAFGGIRGVPNSISALWFRIGIPFLQLLVLEALVLLIYPLVKRSKKNRRSRHERQRRIHLLPNRMLETCSPSITNDSSSHSSQTASCLWRSHLVSYLIVGFLVVVYFSYQNITSELLRAIDCMTIDDPTINHDYTKYAIATGFYVWIEDTNLRCWEGDHFTTGVLALLGLVLFSVGFIVFLFTWPRFNFHRLKEPDFIARYGFIYQGFRIEKQTVSWEAVITLRKGLIAAAVVFALPMGPNLQAVSALGVLIVASAAQFVFRPFETYGNHPNVLFASTTSNSHRKGICFCFYQKWVRLNNKIGLNSLESLSILMSILVFYAAILFNDENTRDGVREAVSYSIAWGNVLFLVFMLYRLYAGAQLSLEMNLRATMTNFEDQSSEDFGMSLCAMVRKIKMLMEYKRREKNRDLALDRSVVA